MKFAYFNPVRITSSTPNLVFLHTKEMVRLHGMQNSSVQDQDPNSVSIFLVVGNMLLALISYSCFSDYVDGQSCATIHP